MALASLLSPAPARPCTAFGLGQGNKVVMGKSYDWKLGNGLVIVNKRGVGKQSVAPKKGEASAKWISKYGSVTFNQYGREMPNGGMNEAGLAIEVLWLDQSVFPPADERPVLNELQVVQYGLDTCATVAELLEAVSKIRVSKIHGAVHYFACDGTGACATLEYLGGKLVTTAGEGLPVKAIANDSCADSIRALRALKKARQNPPKGKASSARYLRAATMIDSTKPHADVKTRSLEILDAVSQGEHSKWNIVYELEGRKIHFRTWDAKTLKDLDLSRLDFACATPARILDINARLEGDVTEKLEEYSTAVNEKLVRTSLSLTKVNLPEETIKGLAEYPARLQCVPARAAPPP
jgi:penicillin V acylase-like amidase (Ntn superfamily)